MNLFETIQDTTSKLNEARDFLRREYLDDSDGGGAWALMCSYGKDSEVLLTLTLEMLASVPAEQRTRHIYVLSSDTRVETPLYKQHMYSEKARVDEAIRKHKLPMSTHIVKPDLRRSYFVTTVGSGHPLSRPGRRRCTHQLKIEPIEQFLESIDYVKKLAGVRAAESAARAAKYGDAKFEIVDQYTGKPMLIPLNRMTDDDIWTRLMAQLFFGESLPVRTLYTKQSKECGYLNPSANRETGGDCGGRNGCFVCPVIMTDQSTEAMAEEHPWLQPHGEWRQLHIEVYGEAQARRTPGMTAQEWELEQLRQKIKNRFIRKVTKSGYMRNGKKLKHGAGCLSLEARKYLLQKLLEAQAHMWELAEDEEVYRPEDMIDEEQLALIQQIHEEDEKERPFLSTGITNIEQAIAAVKEPAEEFFQRIMQRRQREEERRERLKMKQAENELSLFNWQEQPAQEVTV